MASIEFSPGRVGATTPGKRRALERLADDAGTFRMLAVDQRPPVRKLIADKRGLPAGDDPDERDVIGVKQLLLEELAPRASAVLVDPHTAFPLDGTVGARQGLVLTLEDSAFDETPGGRRSKTIDDWSVDQIKRAGGDGVKLLAWYRPDADPAVREHQQAFVEAVGDDCRRHDIPFIFELLLYPLPGDDDPVPFHGAERADNVLASVETFADPRFGVDVFKVESPYLPSELPPPGDDRIDHLAAFRDLDRLIGRPWVLLSGGADPVDFERVLTYAYDAGASGYLAGRSIWWRAVSRFPDWHEMREVLRSDARSVMERIDALTAARARPLGAFAAGSGRRPGPDFCRSYPPAIAAG
jgi:tagatose 1,6-diphosphate aldolase